MIALSQLSISSWKQFDKVKIDFHPNLTVLTGANGSGKSTLLKILAEQLGWSAQEISALQTHPETGKTDFRPLKYSLVEPDGGYLVIGKLEYTDNEQCTITVPNDSRMVFSVSFNPSRRLLGLFIPASRPSFTYTPLENLNTRTPSPQEVLAESQATEREWSGGNGNGSIAANMKRNLLVWISHGYGNARTEPMPELVEHFEGFENVLRKLLPPEIGFQSLIHRNGEILLSCRGAKIPLESVSGGISQIICLAWEIYLGSIAHPEGSIVLIDEVENQLHATLQRSIMPNLLHAFPYMQFVISTHSPLVVGSVKNSNVYALTFSGGEVTSTKLDLKNKAQSATQVLQDILGVPFTMPIWVEEKLEQITSEYSSLELNANTAGKMRSELADMGLEELMPDALVEIANKKHD